MDKLILTLCLFFITSCFASQDVVSNKYFNENEFTGLVKLGTESKDTQLDYELDGTDGKAIHFTSCLQVANTKENDVVTHQFKLFHLLRVNCIAANKYAKASSFKHTNFPGTLSKSLASELPAQAIPNLGGNGLEMRKGLLMGKYEKNLRVGEIKTNSLSVTLTDGIEITYVIMARTDIDGDGYEDWIVRLDWSIPKSFGDGADLMVLFKPSSTSNVKIDWRY